MRRYFWPDLNITGQNISKVNFGYHAVQVYDSNGCLYETSIYIPDAENKCNTLPFLLLSPSLFSSLSATLTLSLF
jgi:hypothetical protein